MAEVQWVRLYTSFFDNKKVRMIRRQKDGDSIVLFYLYDHTFPLRGRHKKA